MLHEKCFVDSVPAIFFFFIKYGIFSNWTTGLSHLRSEVISDQLSLKKDSQVIKFYIQDLRGNPVSTSSPATSSETTNPGQESHAAHLVQWMHRLEGQQYYTEKNFYENSKQKIIKTTFEEHACGNHTRACQNRTHACGNHTRACESRDLYPKRNVTKKA
jgi:hypothetical protein